MQDMNKTVKMNVTVPAGLRAALETRASAEGRNLSNMVTVLLKEAMEKRKAA